MAESGGAPPSEQNNNDNSSTNSNFQQSRKSDIFSYFFFYFAGLSILFPYSMAITITDFWNYKFRNTSIEYNSTSDEFTDLQKNFPGFLSISGNVPLTVLSIITALFGNFFNIKKRLMLSSFTMGLAFAGTTLISGLNTDSWQTTAFVLVMVINSIYSAINAIFQTSFLGNLGRFPPRFIGCTNDGMGLGATLPAIINIVIVATSPDRESIGVTCMVFGVAVIFIQLILYLFSSKTKFYQHYSGVNEPARNSIDCSLYWIVFQEIWIYTLVIFVNFSLTLTAHPAITALVKPVSKESTDWNDKYFNPVCCFLLQAVGDWLGRTIATVSQWPPPGKLSEYGVLTAVILRTGFIPLLMFCNIAPENRNTSVLFEADYAYILILATHSVVGGFIGNVCLMLGPKKVDGYHQEVAGIIQTISLVFGLGVGSLIGPALVQLL